MKDLDYIKNVEKSGILTACMVLARNNLAGNNSDIKLTIKNTKFEKVKVLDKILVTMIKNCLENLHSSEVNEILSTNNVNQFNMPQEKLLTFNAQNLETDPVFDSQEFSLLKTIYGVPLLNLRIENRK